jgi:hypothetical protein
MWRQILPVHGQRQRSLPQVYIIWQGIVFWEMEGTLFAEPSIELMLINDVRYHQYMAKDNVPFHRYCFLGNGREPRCCASWLVITVHLILNVTSDTTSSWPKTTFPSTGIYYLTRNYFLGNGRELKCSDIDKLNQAPQTWQFKFETPGLNHYLQC